MEKSRRRRRSITSTRTAATTNEAISSPYAHDAIASRAGERIRFAGRAIELCDFAAQHGIKYTRGSWTIRSNVPDHIAQEFIKRLKQ